MLARLRVVSVLAPAVGSAVSFRLARTTDVDPVLRLLQDCVTAMREAGIDQWDDVYPNRATIVSDVNEQTLYLAFLGGTTLAATVVLNEYQNPESRACRGPSRQFESASFIV